MTILEEMQAAFPVRKTRRQKEAFRQWAVARAKREGYSASVEQNGGLGKSRNVVIGNPEEAEIIFTAHYDTPPRMLLPNLLLPRSIPLYLLYQLAVVAFFLAAAVAAGGAAALLGADGTLAFRLGWLVYCALLLLMMFGPANPHNANDNTSGTATVLALMAAKAAKERPRVAFILFDNEEKGTLGSRAYAREHPLVRDERLVINLDCVGVGEHLLFLAPEKVRQMPCYECMEKALTEDEASGAVFLPLEKSRFPSDQRNFRRGVGVCACRKGPRIGYYCAKIHTRHDIQCDQGNLVRLTGMLCRLMETTGEGGQSA